MSSQRQAIHSIHNKKFWAEFFYLYESLPALWNTSSPLYKNRQVKCDAYDIMVNKLREIEPNADREDVLRKINIFRTNFRRECSRIKRSLQEGRNYQSTLWYFDLLCFLQTADTRRDRKRKIEDDGEKSIMRKRRTTSMTQNSGNQFIIPFPQKRHTSIKFQAHSSNELEGEYESEIEGEEVDFNYGPDDLGNAFEDEKSDNMGIPLNLLVTNYQNNEEEEKDEDIDSDDQSQKDYSQNDNKINLIATDDVSQPDREINSETEIKMNNICEEQEIFQEFVAENKSESLQTKQWCIRTSNSQNISRLQLEKSGLHVGSITNSKNVNASTKFVRDVKTMTSNIGGKLSESSEILAKSWAVQYDELSQKQKLLARKAINDILFEGCMGHLSIGSGGRVIINDANYKNPGSTKTASNEEVESSEIYEQSSLIASTCSSTSAVGGGQSLTISANVPSAPKDHTTDEWLIL